MYIHIWQLRFLFKLVLVLLFLLMVYLLYCRINKQTKLQTHGSSWHGTWLDLTLCVCLLGITAITVAGINDVYYATKVGGAFFSLFSYTYSTNDKDTKIEYQLELHILTVSHSHFETFILHLNIYKYKSTLFFHLQWTFGVLCIKIK